MFVGRLAREGLAYQTIKVHLSAVRNLHTSAGLHIEFDKQLTPKLEQVLRRIRQEAATKNLPPTQLPITIELMARILKILREEPTNPQHILLWTACCTAFFGLLRVSEFTIPSQTEYDSKSHMSLHDIALDSRIAPSLV